MVPCPGGPLLLRGVSSVRDADGVEHPARRPVVALCRCRRTSEAPWCDGTHRLLAHAQAPTGHRAP
ncbi:CDGSH iron-sulfur domain-containing protein [Nocardioides sp. TRM66260-LWL]|nr:CDGSH iron-sulfur domain-containing protein [Nocardioides sp. TRM66260-LWL]